MAMLPVRIDILFLLLLVLAVGYSIAQHQGSVDGSYLHDPRNIHNKEHIRQHMTDYYKEGDIDEQLNLDSDEATEFHFFKLHDYDKNNKLDGLELYAAVSHYNQEETEKQEGKGGFAPIQLTESQMEVLVNSMLEQDDLNDDGYMDYYEFFEAQRKAREKQPTDQKINI